ncbi:MAG TPA: PDZ domain-containing protein [Pyrinomonadaceae bacterium]|jgi:membrane-associated protease RseP (regulator of RpoE activity)
MVEDIEILNAEDEKLRQMLGGLKKVKAPSNFDFQLKARIANAERNHSPRPFLLPSLRFVLPLSVVVLLAAFIVFNLSLSSGNQTTDVAVNTPQIQNETRIAVPETISTPVISTPVIQETTKANLPANKIEVKNSAPEIAVLNNKTAANKANIVIVKNSSAVRNNKFENTNNDFGGTRQGASRASEVITPENSNTNFNVKKPVEVIQNKISLQEILSQIGIEGDFAANGWKILSVKENSSAMRAGLKAGDLIEAIDDKKLSSDTDFTQNFSVKVFRILREGKQQVIDLTAKK